MTEQEVKNINIFVLILAFIFALGWLKEHISLLLAALPI